MAGVERAESSGRRAESKKKGRKHFCPLPSSLCPVSEESSGFPDLHDEVPAVVVDMVIVDADEQAPVGGHLDSVRCVADDERLPVADASDERADRQRRNSCVVCTTAADSASRARNVTAVGAQPNLSGRL